MSFSHPRSRLLLFAREPVAGAVKTRLQPSLGPERTLALHCDLIRYTWRALIAARVAPVELWVAGDPRHPLFSGLCPEDRIHQQQGEDLGERMSYAAADALSRSTRVVLVGADCPVIDKAYLIEALTVLDHGREVVIGPAEDGGYVLLGLRGPSKNMLRDSSPAVFEQLFSGIPWGTETVTAASIERLQGAGRDFGLLAPRWDVDRPEDLARLRALSPVFGEY
ncbi:MAG: TIGR04282 family arsenosugar biosynthesis glycosyltransferase [Pseudohongiellaceae bacterium]